MVIKNGIHFEELFNAAAHCALYIYTHRFDPMLLEGVGEGDTFSFFFSGPAFVVHIPAMMHLIGWQPCSNQLNDGQTGSEHSCTVQV